MTTIHTTDSPLVRTSTLEVKLATSFAEIDRAMRLRFEVFNLELQEGLRSSYDKGYDSDPYDAYCDHLIVKEIASDSVVGTYRLLRKSRAEKQIGFYSENEFDLSNLLKLPGDLLELGRSCIAASHRTFATISLLWSAIGQYAYEKNISHMFGCASLHRSDIEEVQPIYSYLRARHYAPEKYRVWPLPSCRMEIKDEVEDKLNAREVLRNIPPILKGYLRTGAIVCGPPAYDVEFGTADVFVLLEMEKMAGRYRQHYVGEDVAEAQGLR